jgi:isoquinoline 1-oxidoreductase beta subunit
MEPLNCTVLTREKGCEIWTGTQYQSNDQAAAAKILGLPPEAVQVHTQLLGGGFGRRATPGADFVTEAVHVAKGESVPVKTVWLREDDIQGGYYRPQVYHKLTAGLDAEGHITAWHHTLVSQSIMAGTAFEGFLVKDGVDLTSVEGAADLPYAIPHIQVDLHSPTLAVPVLWWRSVGHSHTAYAVEGFLDELADATGRDPLALRRALLADHPRLLRVLDLAAEKAGWGTPLPRGRGRGIAVRESFESAVAEVAEVNVSEAGELRVERVVCAIDCGFAVNPGHVEAQLEGAIVLGLTAALYGEITLADGRVQQSNFHDYPPLRIGEMPRVEVHIVPSDAPPTGVGEPGLPPIAPAVVNAIFAATGKRIRSLPLSHHDLRGT